MVITERRLRQIIKETLLEEQHRIDESAKDAITKGLLALMITYGANAVTNVTKNLSSNDIQQVEQMHQSYSGSKNNSTVRKNEEIVKAWFQYDKARKMSTNGHPNTLHKRRAAKAKAISSATKTLKSLGIQNVEEAYEEWKKSTADSDGIRSIN